MAEPPSVRDTAPDDAPDTPSDGRRGRLRLILALVLAALVIAAGAGIGVVMGGRTAEREAKRDRAAADRASEQEDDARRERDELDARVDQIEPSTKGLPPATSEGPLLASEKSTAPLEAGKPYAVDGGVYVVNGLRVVDSFTSQEETRPGSARDGMRWVLVDTMYTNRTREDQAPACGTVGTIRVVLTDRTTIDTLEFEPPIAEETYDRCGYNLAPGRSGRWIAPILVPEGSEIAGLHVADVYARTTGSEYSVVAGKAGWLPFDEPLAVGEQGDDEIELDLAGDAS